MQKSSLVAEAKAAPLPCLHEALATGPLGRRYAATCIGKRGSDLWALSFVSPSIRGKLRTPQLQTVDVAAADPVATPALPADTTSSMCHSPQHGLEFRQSAVEDGKKREAGLRARSEAAEAAVSGAVSRAERAEAAAKSMEAAYDVVAEALEDSKKREADLKSRLEECS